MKKQKQILSQQKKEEQVEETAQRFFKLIQAGDLAFFDLIKYALVVFGVTKIGKTTLCHHLNNNPLQGYKDKLDVRYKITTENDSSAKIGDTTDSQTEIPNQFTTTMKIDENSFLQIIDTPGLKDSFGINRILSNAFFHYQVYSKVENMKLLIVLDGSQTNSPFRQFQITMKNYFRTFKTYEELQEKLLNATAVVITKTKPNNKDDKHQKFVEKYEKILELAVNTLIDRKKAFNNDKWLEYLKRFLNHMIKNKKIFVFRQAQQKKPPSQKSMLQQIHKKTKFFSRKIDSNKQNSIDMSEINFSSAALLENISKDPQQKAKKIFDELKLKSIDTIKNLVTLLRYAEEYTLQSINSPSLGKFSELQSSMNKQNNKIINLLKQQIKQKYQFIVDKRYNQKRINIKKKIGQQYKQFDQQHEKLWTTSLQFAYVIFQFIIKYQGDQRMNFQFLTTFKVQILNLLKWMSLFFNQKNKQVFHKYHYCIHRFFQEIHIMLLIANKQDNTLIDENNPMLKIIGIFRQIPNKINQDFLIEMEADPKFNYILKDPNNFFVNFLQKNGNLIIQSKLKEDKIIQFTSQFQLSQRCKIFLMLMNFNYIQREFEKLPVKQFQQKYIIMVNSLIQFLNSLKENKKLMKFKDYQDLRQKFTQIQISIWTMLGNILLENSKIKCENCSQQQRVLTIIQINKLIFNVTYVIKLYQNNIKTLQKQSKNDFVFSFKDKHNEDEQIQIFIQKRNLNNQKIIQEKIKFAQYLNSIGRSGHALIILQQAYSLIKKNPQQRKRVSQMIALIGLGKDKPISEGSYNYYSKLANKEFISNPSKNLSKYLKQLKDQNSAFGTIFDPQYRKLLNYPKHTISPKKNNSTSSNPKEGQVPEARNSI